MKSKEFTALAKKLMPNLPGFAVKGSMAIMRPVKTVLRGIYFEGSSFDTKSFYVWVFFLPLFVPTNVVNFNLGQRLRVPGGGDRWSTDMPNLIGDLTAVIERDALPFLTGVESPLDVARAAGRNQSPQDPYVQQAVAYAWARAGEVKRANDELEKLIHLLDARITWQHALIERADRLRAMLLEKPEDVQAQLDAWENETSRCLGLEGFK